MTGKTKALALLITGISGLTMGAAVSAEEGTSPDLEYLFYTYANENIVLNYEDPDYLYNGSNLDQKTYSGFLALKQLDMNWDGQEELLAVRMKSNTMVAEVYEYQGNKLQRIAQYDLAENVLEQMGARIDTFLVTTDSGVVLCCEAEEDGIPFSYDLDWSFRAVGFDGAQMVEYTRCDMEGEWTEEKEAQALAAVGALGLYPAQIFGTAITDQVGNVEWLNSIQRYTYGDYQETDFPEAETLQYGETFFQSHVNTQWENKITGQFVTSLGVRETAGTQDGFIISDSDSRYIQADELDRLSEYEILLARNEIYARHGRIFNNEELNAYFSSQSWYVPSVTGENFTESYAAQVFNDYEITNISTIVTYEKEHGLNQF